MARWNAGWVFGGTKAFDVFVTSGNLLGPPGVVTVAPPPPPPQPTASAPAANPYWPDRYQAVSAVEAWNRSLDPLGTQQSNLTELDILRRREERRRQRQLLEARSATEAAYVALYEEGVIDEEELATLLMAEEFT